MIANLHSGCAAKIRIEAGLITDRPEELAGIHYGGRQLFRGRTILSIEQSWILSPHHHRTGRVDGNNPGTFLDEREQNIEICASLSAERFQVTVLPCRHAAALQAANTAHIHFVALHHLDCIASDLWLVVLNIASLKQDHFAFFISFFRVNRCFHFIPFFKTGVKIPLVFCRACGIF